MCSQVTINLVLSPPPPFLLVVHDDKEVTRHNISDILVQVLDSLSKNCGEHVFQQIVERDILREMVKIVKKKVSYLHLTFDI